MTVVGSILLLLLAIPSGLLIVFEKKINCRMVALVLLKSVAPGDMIATNLMKSSEISYFNKRSEGIWKIGHTSAVEGLEG